MQNKDLSQTMQNFLVMFKCFYKSRSNFKVNILRSIILVPKESSSKVSQTPKIKKLQNVGILTIVLSLAIK